MIILVEVTDIINAVEKHGHPFDAQTEGEAGPPVRVQFDQLEHLWIDHPHPMISIHRLLSFPRLGPLRSTSKLGSVNGKKLGRNRVSSLSPNNSLRK